jgi:uncharacterized protein YndB with AHSA1/START domain
MKWLKRVLGAVVALIVLLLIVGALIPADYAIERSVVVQASPARLYPLVADPKRWRDWSVWTRRDPAMKIDYFGADAGAGAGWSWDSKTEGEGRMTITRADPATGLAYELYFPDFDSTSHGELRFTAEGTATRITWTNAGNTGRNPLMHFMAPLMDRLVGPDFEAGLANLKALAEKA